MRFSKSEERVLNIYIYTGWLVFMQKRQNGILFPLTHKEGRLDTFDRVVFLVEMGWCSNSRNAV